MFLIPTSLETSIYGYCEDFTGTFEIDIISRNKVSYLGSKYRCTNTPHALI